jgi:hypothetical protein
MLSEAIETMKHVVEVADKALEEERKATIANFIAAIFMLIPVAGELAAAVGGATMRAIIGMAGELANVGLTIYELVDDPSSALSTVLGFVIGGGVSRRPFKEAAAARRGMSSTEKGKLAPRVKTDLDTITNLRTACLKKQKLRRGRAMASDNSSGPNCDNVLHMPVTHVATIFLGSVSMYASMAFKRMRSGNSDRSPPHGQSAQLVRGCFASIWRSRSSPRIRFPHVGHFVPACLR